MVTRRALLALLSSSTIVACGDNNHPGESSVLISPTADLYTDEAGATATFTIALTEAPARNVAVRLSSRDEGEGEVSPTGLIFTEDNYQTPQTVTITGVDDNIADGDTPYRVRIATDLLGTFELNVFNLDDDSAGVVVTPLVGLMTTEAGATASFTVALTSEPIDSVIVPIASSDESEGVPDTAALTFTAANWNDPQTVTVTGAQDSINDGSVAYSILLGKLNSADLTYDEMDPEDVSVTNVDDDVFGIAVTPTTGLVTTEAGGTATFQLVLQQQPSANVTFDVSSSNTAEATVSTGQITFTPANWDQVQVVTVTGKDDAVDDDDKPYTIVLSPVTSTDPDYAGIDPPDVTGTNTDNDTASITVTPSTGLVTTEGAGTDSFSVVLTSQPTASVVIGVSSSDTTEGVAGATMLTFTTANWMMPQTVIVTGQDDATMDGDVAYTIQLATPSTTDLKYGAIDPADVSATNQDNDVPGFSFDPPGGLEVSELGDADQAAVTLNTQPSANVTITFTSSDLTEGIVLPATMTFTPANWNVPQFVAVTGVNDTDTDGDVVFSIVTGTSSSTDTSYNGINPPDISVTNFDNETPAVYVKSKKVMTVSENGTSTTFRVRPTVAPIATVTCTLQSTDLTEGTVSPTTLTFQPNNYGFRTVTVTGVDDMEVDGDRPFAIQLNACTSTDPLYSGFNPRDVGVVNKDNDLAPLHWRDARSLLLLPLAVAAAVALAAHGGRRVALHLLEDLPRGLVVDGVSVLIDERRLQLLVVVLALLGIDDVIPAAAGRGRSLLARLRRLGGNRRRQDARAR